MVSRYCTFFCRSTTPDVFLHAAPPGDPIQTFVPRHSPGYGVGDSSHITYLGWDHPRRPDRSPEWRAAGNGDADLRPGHRCLVISVIRNGGFTGFLKHI